VQALGVLHGILACLALVAAAGSHPLLAADAPAPVLHLHGSIDPALSYSAWVEYIATDRRSECSFDDAITGMRAPLRRQIALEPKIGAGRHDLRSPLEMTEAPACAWRPVALSLCVAAPGAETSRCEPLLLYRPDEHTAEAPLAITCSAASGQCEDQSGHPPQRLVADLRQDLVLDITASR